MTYSLADLSQSVFHSLGLTNTRDPLSLGESPAQRECILLVDGLGMNAIENYSALPIINQLKLRMELSANFPSTTATSLATLGTGELPGVHGMLGYTVRVPRSGEPGRLLNALRWDERVDPVMWQRVPTLFERAVKEEISVSHVAAKRYEATGFTQAALRGASYRGANVLDELISETAQALRKERSFCYLYINDVDDSSHSDGMGSEKWHLAMKKTNDLITRLLTELPHGTRLWITADHGMVNRKDAVVIGKENDLLTDVTLLGGEPRARHIYVRNGAETEVKNRWQEFFGNKAEILTKSEAVARGYFGSVVTEDSLDRLGDVIAIPHGELVLIEPEKEKQQLAMVGHHGGITDSEVRIPLFTHIQK